MTPRPCTCDRVLLGSPYDLTQCRLCWLYHHDPDYRAAWGGDVTVVDDRTRVIDHGRGVRVITRRVSGPGEVVDVLRDFGIPAQDVTPEPPAPAPQTAAPPPEGPGLGRRALNFGSALVRHVAAGSPAAPADVKTQRIEICRSCPLYNAAKDVCTRCGCIVRVKAAWADQSCPEGKWKAVGGRNQRE